MRFFVVVVIPVITLTPTNTTVTSGEDVNFTCTATGKPRAVISWLRNNNKMISNNSLSDGGVPVIITNSTMGNCTITDPPSQCVSSSRLQIFNTRAVDSGEYTCVANNVAGSVDGTTKLIVNGKWICVENSCSSFTVRQEILTKGKFDESTILEH